MTIYQRDPTSAQPTQAVTATRAEIRASLMDQLGFVPIRPPSATRTLSSVRTSLVNRLGFFTPAAAATGRTLAQARATLTSRLGFTTPQSVVTSKTLDQMRTFLLVRLGFADQTPTTGVVKMLDAIVNEAQATVYRRFAYGIYSPSPPPVLVNPTDVLTIDARAVEMISLSLAKAHYGQADAAAIANQSEQYMTELSLRSPPGLDVTLNNIINEAQQQFWRRYAQQVNPGFVIPAQMTSDADVISLDNELVELLALANAKAHFSRADAPVYLQQFETQLADLLKHRPPNMIPTLSSIINAAQQSVWQRFGYDAVSSSHPAQLVSESDVLSVDDTLVEAVALANAKGHFGHADAPVYLKQVEQYLAEQQARQPPNVVAVLNRIIESAQTELYNAFEYMRTVKWFSFPTVAGQALYTAFGTSGTDVPDVDRIAEVKIERDGFFYPLRDGIPGESYTLATSRFPVRYELRGGFELWPPPDREYIIHIRAPIALRRLSEDSDTTTLPSEVVTIQSLAVAKAHYGQNDAGVHASRAAEMRRQLASRAHGTKRYIPGQPDPEPIYPLPVVV